MTFKIDNCKRMQILVQVLIANVTYQQTWSNPSRILFYLWGKVLIANVIYQQTGSNPPLILFYLWGEVLIANVIYQQTGSNPPLILFYLRGESLGYLLYRTLDLHWIQYRTSRPASIMFIKYHHVLASLNSNIGLGVQMKC